jgi:hypothetical protein
MSIRLGLNISVSPRSLFAALNDRVIAKLLFSNDEPGVFYDFDDWSTLFQDTAGTQPVTAANQGVALALDKSGNDNHATQATTAARPLTVIHPDGGVRNLLEDTEFNVNAPTGSISSNTNVGGGAISLAAGVSAQIVSYGVQDGIRYADVRFSGTFSGQAVTWAFARTGEGPSAQQGQNWTQSAFFQRVSGSAANHTTSLRIQEFSGSTFLFQTVVQNISVTEAAQRFSATGTLSSASTNAVRGLFVLSSSGAFDVTYRVYSPQLEEGPTATPYQKRVNFLDVTEAGKRSIRRLYFNGTSHFMTTPTITPNTDKAQVFAGVRKLSDAAAGAIAELGPNYNTNPPAFFLVASSGGSANYAWRASGTFSTNTGATQNSTPFVAPISNVVTGLTALTGVNTDHIFRVDGAQNYVGISGVTGTAFINQAIFIGARGGTSVFFNGYLDQLIARFGTNLDSGAIETTEKYVSTKSPELVAASEVTWNASTDTYTQNLVGLGR